MLTTLPVSESYFWSGRNTVELETLKFSRFLQSALDHENKKTRNLIDPFEQYGHVSGSTCPLSSTVYQYYPTHWKVSPFTVAIWCAKVGRCPANCKNKYFIEPQNREHFPVPWYASWCYGSFWTVWCKFSRTVLDWEDVLIMWQGGDETIGSCTCLYMYVHTVPTPGAILRRCTVYVQCHF